MNLKAFLVQHKVEFTFLEKGSTHHAEETSRLTGLPLQQIAKTLVFVDQNGGPLIAIVRADQEVSRHKLCAAAQRRSVSIAPAGLAQKVTGYPTGGIPPVGHRQQVPVFLDSNVSGLDSMWFGGGARTKLVRLRVQDVVGLTSATLANISI